MPKNNKVKPENMNFRKHTHKIWANFFPKIGMRNVLYREEEVTEMRPPDFILPDVNLILAREKRLVALFIFEKDEEINFKEFLENAAENKEYDIFLIAQQYPSFDKRKLVGVSVEDGFYISNYAFTSWGDENEIDAGLADEKMFSVMAHKLPEDNLEGFENWFEYLTEHDSVKEVFADIEAELKSLNLL